MQREADRDRQDADQVGGICSKPKDIRKANQSDRVRTLTGKEIELDIEADYKVRSARRHTSTNNALPLGPQNLPTVFIGSFQGPGK